MTSYLKSKILYIGAKNFDVCKKLNDVGIKENLTKIKEQIGNNNVKIIAVTKYANQKQIYEAYKLGIRDFGESYLQDALEKISQKYQEEKIENLTRWHFIGRLQKNKVKSVVEKFCLIHSVDSIELAELINKIANQKGLVQDILLQVNISQEPTKAGFQIGELKNSFGALLKLANVRVQGLMTIGPKTSERELTRNCFSSLSTLKDEVNKEYMLNLKELSMGMSNDYVIAVGCGATMVRIGKAIFKEG